MFALKVLTYTLRIVLLGFLWSVCVDLARDTL
jgi:hypothetical protein